MKVVKSLLFGLVVLAVLGIVGWLVLFREQTVAVEAAKAVRGPIEQFIDERGQTTLPREYLITMPYEGRIEPISLEAGDPVAEGDVVARISEVDLKEELALAQAQVAQLEASIRENYDASVEELLHEQTEHFVTSMGLTVEAAEERLEPSRARFQFARTNLERVETLFGQQVATQEELDAARVAYTEAESSLRQDTLTWRITQATEAATLLMPQMISQYITRKQTLSQAVLQDQLAEAQARLDQVTTRAKRGIMTSPVDGVVLERLETNQRYLPAGQLLLRIGQLDELEVEADILSQEVVDVVRGDPVVIYGPAVGPREDSGVAGNVRLIHPAGFTKVSSLGVEQQRVTVVIGFDPGVLAELRERRDIGVDYRVRVRIITDSRENALVVPRSALFRGPQGGWQVMAIRRGRAELVNVEVGLMNDNIAEIIEGVAEGESVILAPESNVTTGTRVRIAVSE